MNRPTRVATVGPSACDLAKVLGLLDGEGAPINDDLPPKSLKGCPFSPFVPGHPTSGDAVVWRAHFNSLLPDVVIADVTCNTCLEGGTHKVWPGPPTLFAIGRPTLAECLDLLLTVGNELGLEERARREFTQRSARLLALRMHVARFLVRTPGATRPVALALIRDGETWRVRDDPRSAEIFDAAGCLPAQIPRGAIVSEREIASVHVDVIVAGSPGARTTHPATTDHVNALAHAAPAVWHVDWNAILESSGPSIVDAVESVLRATFPKALGANGTPPSPSVLRRATMT